MLPEFNNQTDIPEAFREHYSKREDGKWHADIPDSHPAVKHNAKLLSEKQGAETKVTQLTSDLESARAGNLGRGQVAVARSEVALLDEYKALGAPADVKVKLTEYETLKGDAEKRSKEDKLVLVAKELGYDNVEAFKRLPGLPDFDIRIGKDGKNSVFALVKDGDKTVEKPATEFLESSPDHAPFLSALKTQPPGVTVHTTPSTTTPKAGEPFAWAKEFAKNYSESSAPVNDLAKSFAERSA